MDPLNQLGKAINPLTHKGIKSELAPIEKAKESESIEKKEEVDTKKLDTSEANVARHVPQSEVRNMNFKLNSDTDEMYVEITNADDEVVKTIPADKNDPRFIEILSNSKPGMIINDKS